MAREAVSADSGDTFPVTNEYDHAGNDVTFQFVNGLDVSADFTVYGTHDTDANFSDQVVAIASVTVSSDSVDSATLSEQWDKLKVEVSATSPTSGSATAYMHSADNF